MTLKRPEEYDFLDPALQKCPFEFYQSLREYAPVYREPATGYYIVSGNSGWCSDGTNYRHCGRW